MSHLVPSLTFSRSKRGDALEVSTDICVPSKSARQSAALSAEEIAMFASVTRVHDFTETLVHTVDGRKVRTRAHVGARSNLFIFGWALTRKCSKI